MGEQRYGYEHEVEHGCEERDAVPSPVAVGHERRKQDEPGSEYGDERRNAKKPQAGANGDEFGDQREEVADHQVDHGKPSPERAEAVEDEFGVSAMGSGAEADRH